MSTEEKNIIELKNGNLIVYNGGLINLYDNLKSNNSLKLDVIVNAANNKGTYGSGIDGEINNNGGKDLIDERENWKPIKKDHRINTGSVKVSSKGKLGPIIHAVGPDFRTAESKEDINNFYILLSKAYKSSMKEAENIGAKNIGFSLLSSGIYRGNKGKEQPLAKVLKIGIDAIKESTYEKLEKVYMACYTMEEFNELVKLINTEKTSTNIEPLAHCNTGLTKRYLEQRETKKNQILVDEQNSYTTYPVLCFQKKISKDVSKDDLIEQETKESKDKNDGTDTTRGILIGVKNINGIHELFVYEDINFDSKDNEYTIKNDMSFVLMSEWLKKEEKTVVVNVTEEKTEREEKIEEKEEKESKESKKVNVTEELMDVKSESTLDKFVNFVTSKEWDKIEGIYLHPKSIKFSTNCMIIGTTGGRKERPNNKSEDSEKKITFETELKESKTMEEKDEYAKIIEDLKQKLKTTQAAQESKAAEHAKDLRLASEEKDAVLDAVSKTLTEKLKNKNQELKTTKATHEEALQSLKQDLERVRKELELKTTGLATLSEKLKNENQESKTTEEKEVDEKRIEDFKQNLERVQKELEHNKLTTKETHEKALKNIEANCTFKINNLKQNLQKVTELNSKLEYEITNGEKEYKLKESKTKKEKDEDAKLIKDLKQKLEDINKEQDNLQKIHLETKNNLVEKTKTYEEKLQNHTSEINDLKESLKNALSMKVEAEKNLKNLKKLGWEKQQRTDKRLSTPKRKRLSTPKRKRLSTPKRKRLSNSDDDDDSGSTAASRKKERKELERGGVDNKSKTIDKGRKTMRSDGISTGDDDEDERRERERERERQWLATGPQKVPVGQSPLQWRNSPSSSFYGGKRKNKTKRRRKKANRKSKTLKK
jgi:O-acetyl-ADP-ribose deacetylase (regulator of RNase III)